MRVVSELSDLMFTTRLKFLQRISVSFMVFSLLFSSGACKLARDGDASLC